MRTALAEARSVSEAATKLGVVRSGIQKKIAKTTDPELRALYRACVERGKRRHEKTIGIETRRPEPSPHFGIYLQVIDYEASRLAMTTAWTWLRIWGVDAIDEKDAIRIALPATGRDVKDLKAVREVRK
jgi:hypothetical protein